MTNDDRVQTAAVIALLAAVLAAVWGWRTGLASEPIAWLSGAAYGAALLFVAPALQAPPGATAVTSIKYAAFTTAYSVWVAVAGIYAIGQLLRGRADSKVVFA
ncbi:hypothetical protein PV735_46750 [Streptomyces turgidiscabies]|uniref:hypothetical protein n=1 Tax=Streptomyces turgidiscabies TaxID=85558 RepID=UPI00073E63C9|nr:hypothetical protein [Streptomyces turgidiscabies]MDX3500121.1 hypothetical protein [Streptomyces turgidiscabies]GAQ77203.1 hypothetical protein T45_09019 [Streptomyces turgidiscabies]